MKRFDTVPMRILHVLDHSIPLQSGYTFRTMSILRQQRARGWQTFHLTSPKHKAPADREMVGDLEFYRSSPNGARLGHSPAIGELMLMRSLALRLQHVVDEVQPQILHAHSPVLNALPTLWVGRRNNIPVVYEVRAFWEDAAVSHGTSREGGPRYFLSRQLESFALRRADWVTTICRGLEQDIVKRGIAADKVTVIPNAVDVEKFAGPGKPDSQLRARLGLQGKTVLGFFGSFYFYEGLHLLLQAMPRLLRLLPDVGVLLVGGGPEDRALRQLAKELQLESAVTFVGRVPHDQIQNYYDLADLLIYPRISLRLTELVTPLKPLEAMAQQKIVLASDVGGHRELVRDGETGYLFRADDAESLVQGVAMALSKREQWPEIRQRARRFVATERSWPVSVARYDPVYRRLAGLEP